MTIYTQEIDINDIPLLEQPSRVDESPNFIYSDQTSISGYKERQTFGKRSRVVMTWNYASPSTVSNFMTLENAGAPVRYRNSNSPWFGRFYNFTGILTTNAGEYMRGGSGLAKFKVTIEEGITQ